MARSKKTKDAQQVTPTLVVFLLDKSGSMRQPPSKYSATIEGFNGYLDGLRDTPDMEFSLVMFCGQSTVQVCTNMPIAEAPRLSPSNYILGGSTPLIDASYKTILAAKEAVRKREVKPKVVICIMTDGEENTSTEYTNAQLKALKEECEGFGWQFNLMGADINAYHMAREYGFSDAQTMSYDASNLATASAAFLSNASNTVGYASGTLRSTRYSAVQKLAAGDKHDPALKRQRRT